MSETTIEWAHYTFNPWSGCAKVSPGCKHCYAAALPPRMRRGAEWGEGRARMPASETYWLQPLAWARKAEAEGVRRRVFCASTADVFEDRPDLDPWREQLWRLIGDTPQLDWLLLTKRPERMARWAAEHGWPANAWAGTSVENQAAADERVPHLLKVPARVRFLSCEPLLGPVQLGITAGDGRFSFFDYGLGETVGHVEWIIVGGESGRHARPMHPDWVRGLRDQAAAAGVPFLFKQWGEWIADSQANGVIVDAAMIRDQVRIDWAQDLVASLVGKKLTGRRLDGVEHLAFPGGGA
jgi:protein gp37